MIRPKLSPYSAAMIALTAALAVLSRMAGLDTGAEEAAQFPLPGAAAALDAVVAGLSG